jgi:tetratricopeptide (TPR) repeat protein
MGMSDAPSDSLERLNEALAGRYRLRHQVGEGGMAVVYAADDLRYDRTVAIKVLRADLVDSTGAQRFLREIQVVAKLSHPHILPMLDSGMAGPLPYYVMPFIEGDSLAGLMERSGPFSLEETIRITREIARGLAHAHEQGFVHRDIKPDNILFSSGHAVITDFGIAQAINQAAENRLTGSGSAVGTATYMSPEQWTGAPVDAKSDQYSLACIAYEMLVGAPPFSTSQAVFERHLKGTIPSLRVRRPNTTAEVDATVTRALSKAPGDRFATVLAFVEALETGPNPTSIDRSLTSGVAPAERSSRKWIIGLAMAGLTVAAGLVAWSLFGGGGDDGQTRLVVLPFDTLGEPGNAYFAEGIAEEITNQLGEISSIGVVGRTSARRYAGTALTSAEIGAELGVTHLIEGSVRWYELASSSSRVPTATSADSARVTVRLLRAVDGVQIWGAWYDVASSGLIDGAANIAAEVARELDVVLDGDERERLSAAQSRNGGAYERLLLGNAAYDRSRSRPDVVLALENYQRAVELDPDYAMGWAKLSRTHSWMNELGFDTSEDRLVAAREAADRALALDPDLPEAHLALGLYHYWGRKEYEPALAELEEARRLRPSDGQVYAFVAAIRERQGRFGEAIQLYQQVADLDPRSARAWLDLGETLLYTRMYDEARPHLETALQLSPDLPDAYLQLARVALNPSGDLETARPLLREAENRMRPGAYGLDSATYLVAKARLLMQTRGRAAAAPQLDSARVLLSRMATEQPDQAWIHGLLSTVYAGLNLADEAVRSAERAMELRPVEVDALDGPEYVHALATAYVMLGRVDEAVACFDRVLAVPSWISAYSLGVDPLLEPLHDTPQLERLVAKWAPTGGATLGSPVGRTSCP